MSGAEVRSVVGGPVRVATGASAAGEAGTVETVEGIPDGGMCRPEATSLDLFCKERWHQLEKDLE